ncbi:radical SAM family heme chaperone HemW [Runella sp.]|uniref:radical SAM family heme chaperone HemW n=1 Tax=Runella sp. TaxID=1960881 RepID=UPI00260C5D91|nr:radical SAM family heme chaperone HemW [Runella sp.]
MHLYLHIPFCKQACHYCDFHFSTHLKSKADLVTAICQEIELQKDYLPARTLETIYFGGGTPSLLTESELGQIFEAIHRIYQVESDVEITLEANPDDITREKIAELKPFINRLSIGIQSFHEPYLRFMNRAHNAVESEQCVKLAQDSGFENLTIDLIYGMSERLLGIHKSSQDSDEQLWQRDLEMAVALNTPHISAYNLTIEPQTALGNWLKKGKIKPVEEELSARQFEQMISYLNTNGYEQYEISNFARNGHYARHNSSYWKRRPYLGVGPSAHSFNGASRQYNIANNALYIKSIQEENLPFESEILTAFDQVNDYLLTSLRTIWGCDLGVIKEISGIDLLEIQKPYLAAFFENEWIHMSDNVLFLTPKGKLFADRIASDLFLV